MPRGIEAFAGSSAPSGWLLCYGQAVSRTTYATLFTAIGTVHGIGDGSTTFNLPDLRGRTLFGKDDMGGSGASRLTTAGSSVDGTTLGASGGSQLMHQHTHTVTDAGHTHALGNQSNGWQGGGGAIGITSATGYTATGTSQTTGSATTGITLANAGSGSSQNVPPAFVINWIIKV